MTDNEKMLIHIPAGGEYIEILGHRIDGFDSFEAFCQHLGKFTEMEETINRQKETIEQLKTALFKCGEDAVEIENYKKIAEYQQSLSMDRGFEIKRLKEEIERLQKYYDSMEESIDSFRKDQAEVKFFKDRIRAEAVKEFAEMLTDRAGLSQLDSFNYAWLISQEDIDNLVKEFTEGGKG